MRNSLLISALGVLLLSAAAVRGQSPQPPTLAEVGNKVMCTCGCVAILNQCPHQGCSTHEEIGGVIQKLIAEGKSEPEILQALTARYGMKILAAPTTTGFNLTAWVLPGVGLILGLMAVIVLVRRWHRPAAVSGPAPPPVDPKMLAALEEEMKASGLGTRGPG